MNRYNQLYIIALIEPPYLGCYGSKFWTLQLSKSKYKIYLHRDFDLIAYRGGDNYKIWYRYNRYHRLIGPSFIVRNHRKLCKFYYLMGDTHKK